MRDVLPVGHVAYGPSYFSFRQDIEHELEIPILVHRNVGLPFFAHLRGPYCPCCPIVKTEGEVQASGWNKQQNYFGAPH